MGQRIRFELANFLDLSQIWPDAALAERAIITAAVKLKI
jgi:hypothetical protein